MSSAQGARPMWVEAVGVWTPTFPSFASWSSAESCSEPGPPAAESLPRRARGRASMLTRMLAEVVSQCGGQDLPLIFGSAYGEMKTTGVLLGMLGDGAGQLSPARFQASVHNTAAGQVSIAHGNQLPSSSIAAGEQTWAMGLIEAHSWLLSGHEQVCLAVGDEALADPFAERHPYDSLAVAVRLSLEPRSESAVGLRNIRYEVAPSAADGARPEVNPCQSALTTLEGLLLRGPTGRQFVPGTLAGTPIALSPTLSDAGGRAWVAERAG